MCSLNLNSEIFLSIADTFQRGHWNLELASTIGANADGGNGAEPLDHSETTVRHRLVLCSRLRKTCEHLFIREHLKLLTLTDCARSCSVLRHSSHL